MSTNIINAFGPTGSWKDYFAFPFIQALKKDGYKSIHVRSSGNLGLAIANAAKEYDMGCRVEGNDMPDLYNHMLRLLGAEIVQSDREAPSDCYKYLPYVDSAYAQGARRGYHEIAKNIVASGIPDIVAMPACYGDGALGVVEGLREIIGTGKALPMIILGRCLPHAAPDATSINTDQTSSRIKHLIDHGALSEMLGNEDIYLAKKSLKKNGHAVEFSAAAGQAAVDALPARMVAGKKIAVVLSAIERHESGT